MNCIVFENTGEIDLRLVSTFGCSVKETDNPIGFFGTGLKYALAVLLRLGQKVTLQSGLVQYDISSLPETVRGKQFEFVVARNGDESIPLGFTTELGKTWELWMAYRELYCNTKDEQGGKTVESNELPVPESGITRVVVAGDAFCSVHRGKSEFILEGVPDFVYGDIEIFNRPTLNFFYKGIKVMQHRHPALLTYNYKNKLDLTEDRTVKDPYNVPYKIAQAVLEFGEGRILERVLTAAENQMEHYLDFHGWSTTPSPDFFPTVAKLQTSELGKINHTALRLWREKGAGFLDPKRVRLSALQNSMLQKAIAFCEKFGFDVQEYPIIVAETLGSDGTMALADLKDKQIMLSLMLFNESGTKGVVRGLVEEYIHLKFGFEDCSRSMQTYLFSKIISIMEELSGEPL